MLDIEEEEFRAPKGLVDTELVLTKFLLDKIKSPNPFSLFIGIFSNSKFNPEWFKELCTQEISHIDLSKFKEYIKSLSIVERMALYYTLERIYLDRPDYLRKVVAALTSIGCNFDFQTEIKNFDWEILDKIRSWLVFYIVKFIFFKLLELKSESLDNLRQQEDALLKLAPYNSYVVKNFLRQWLISQLNLPTGNFIAELIEFIKDECRRRSLFVERNVIQDKIELILESLAYL